MALVLSTSVKANVRLEQAVKQFEAILTPHHAAQFRAHRNAASTLPPTIIDVRNLLLEVDNIVRLKASSRRAFSPRLSSVVEAVQKFASIGDILIGGSQNLIACGVWSIVRLALLAIATSSSTLERLSTFFMAIGRSAPRHEDLALLYPQSERLQTYLCEYHIIVVNLCRELVLFTQKSAVSLLMSSLNPSVWNSHQASIEQWSMCIREEISSLTAHTIESESLLNSTFRASVTRELNKDSVMRQLGARRRALNACTTYDYETTFRQQRKAGITEFFKDLDVYKFWKSSTVSSTLIIDGKLGSGKTVMLANIIDDLRKDAEKTGTNIAYFFCRHDVPDSLKARVILGSLAREILRTLSSSASWETISELLTTSTSVDSIHDILLQILPIGRITYFVIDGIDECDMQTIGSIHSALNRLQRSRKLAICISCRTYSPPTVLLCKLTNSRILVMPENNSDINIYIAAELERRVQIGSLTLGDPNLIKDIYDALVTGADGMFLWVTLQIECLCYQESDKRVRAALRTLPRTLPDVFARLLYEAAKDEAAKNNQIRVLELVVSAVRPLQEGEMQEALSVQPGITDWDPSNLVHNIQPLLASCGSLLIVDEEDRSVRLVHHSVLQYLREQYKRLDGSKLTGYNADRSFAAILITYLNYGVFQTQVTKVQYPKLPMNAIQSTVVQSTLNSSFKRKIAMRILKQISGPDHDAGHMVGTEVVRMLGNETEMPLLYHLCDYARAYLLSHAWVYLNELENTMVSLLRKLMARDKELANLYRQTIAKKTSSLTWSSQDGRGLALADLLCEGVPSHISGLPSIFDGYPQTNGHEMQSFLAWTCEDSSTRVVEYWLRKVTDGDIPYPRIVYGKAIRMAFDHGHHLLASILGEHVSRREPSLAFLTAWLQDQQSNIQQIDVDWRESEGIEMHLDLILREDNADGLSFLLECDIINCNRVHLIQWESSVCPISLLDRCIWNHSKKCRNILKVLAARSHIQNLMAFDKVEAAIRNRLLCNAIRLDFQPEAISLIKASTILQRMDEKTQLHCLSLAIEQTNAALVECILKDWFRSHVERSLLFETKPIWYQKVIEILLKKNIKVKIVIMPDGYVPHLVLEKQPWTINTAGRSDID